jgi:hypothetical protein
MHCKPRRFLVAILGLLFVAAPLTFAVHPAAGQQPSAKIVRIEGTPSSYQVEGQKGQMVNTGVPAMSDVRTSGGTQEVRGTVTEIDQNLNQMKVKTAEGQTVVLEVSPDLLASLQIGAPLVLDVPR